MPTLEEEIALEEVMQKKGEQNYQQRQIKRIERGQMSMTAPAKKIISGGVGRVEEGLQEWIQEQWVRYEKQKRGRKSAEYILLQACPADVIATITLRVVIDHLPKTPKEIDLAHAIGLAIEQECRYLVLKARSPALFRWAREHIAKSTSRRHKASVMSWTAKKAGVEWTPWTNRQRVGVGGTMLHILTTKVGLVDRKSVTMKKGKKIITECVVKANAGTLAWFKAFNQEAMASCPVLLPTIIPPRPWSNPFNGGYHSEKHIGQLTLCPSRGRAKRGYLQELENCNPVQVYSAVNHLQATAWSVNKDVLEVVTTLWTGPASFAGLPPHDDLPEVPRPADIATNEEARKAYRTAAAKVHATNAALYCERLPVHEVLDIAKRFSRYGRFYFPYYLDFRGRVYAFPPGLNPQGSPLAKGLLTFADGKRISTPEAYRWFCIHGANCAGVDKVSFDSRVAWVEERRSRIIRTAEDPYADLWWTEVDSPFCFLAFCFEFAGYCRNPSGFLSRLPIMLDGSCSGLQHFSAMLRDADTARRVNLTPSDKPQDVYGEVAADTRASLEAMQTSEEASSIPGWTLGAVARYWLRIGTDRSLLKRGVMTLPYGSTRHSHGTYIYEQLCERLGIKGKDENKREHMRLSSWLANMAWKSIEKLVSSALVVMEWLQEVTRRVSKAGMPVSWMAPSGFPVLQSYQKTKAVRIKLALGDTVRRYTLQEPTPELDASKQTSGISPNFVHSMDAAALVSAVNDAKAEGIHAVSCNHDCFGTHAADTEAFAKAIKRSFVRMYTEHDVLEEFREALESLGVELPPAPPKGTLDISLVMASNYCFA